MTDEELIKRLRDAPADGLGTENLCIAAADRIEALVKRLDTVKDKAEAHIIDLMAERDRAEARAERMEAALRKIAEGNFIGRAEGYAFAALSDVAADVVTYGVGITQDGKHIAPQDFFAVRDVDDKS